MPLSAEENHSEKITTAAKTGVLNGRYRVTFTNGNHITFVSHGETTLLSEKGKPKLQSHLDGEETLPDFSIARRKARPLRQRKP
ncbi:hypothetical protein ACNKHV_14130 [Shigella flexneri]